MSDALPKIKVTDVHTDGQGTQGRDTPSTITDGGPSARPRSATSSEGAFLLFYIILVVYS